VPKTIDTKSLIKEPLSDLLLWRNNARKRIRQSKKEWLRLQQAIAAWSLERCRLDLKVKKVTKKLSQDREWTKILNDTLIKKVLRNG